MSQHSVAEVFAALTRLPVQPRMRLRCAARRAVERVYTLNLRDFRQLAPAGLEEKIRAP